MPVEGKCTSRDCHRPAPEARSVTAGDRSRLTGRDRVGIGSSVTAVASFDAHCILC
jgi:hypothetical protein